MQTKILAHRGASLLLPENTLEALVRAIELGADGVELDCQRTRDGVVVVFHDESLRRLTGKNCLLKDVDYAELCQLRVKNELCPEGLPIPTLQSVFNAIKSISTTAIINVELKNSIVHDPGLEDAVVTLAKQTGMLERLIFSSFNHYSVRWFVENGLGSQAAALFDGNVYKPWLVTEALGVTSIHPLATNLLFPDFISETKAHGLTVRPWTIDDPNQLGYALQLGLDAIITNDPVTALQIRESLREPVLSYQH